MINIKEQAQPHKHKKTAYNKINFLLLRSPWNTDQCALSADMRVQGNHSTLNALLVQSLPPQLPPP